MYIFWNCYIGDTKREQHLVRPDARSSEVSLIIIEADADLPGRNPNKLATGIISFILKQEPPTTWKQCHIKGVDDVEFFDFDLPRIQGRGLPCFNEFVALEGLRFGDRLGNLTWRAEIGNSGNSGNSGNGGSNGQSGIVKLSFEPETLKRLATEIRFYKTSHKKGQLRITSKFMYNVTVNGGLVGFMVEDLRKSSVVPAIPFYLSLTRSNVARVHDIY